LTAKSVRNSAMRIGMYFTCRNLRTLGSELAGMAKSSLKSTEVGS